METKRDEMLRLYLKGMSQSAIARELGTSRQNVHQTLWKRKRKQLSVMGRVKIAQEADYSCGGCKKSIRLTEGQISHSVLVWLCKPCHAELQRLIRNCQP